MKKALILNNQVIQIENADFPVAAPLFWVDCADDTTINHVYENNQIVLKLPTAAEIAAAAAAAALAELVLIDASSVRAMREYIASKADAPQILKDKEAAAVIARAKLK